MNISIHTYIRKHLDQNRIPNKGMIQKTFSRFPQIKLPEVSSEVTLFAAFKKRLSKRSGRGAGLSVHELAYILTGLRSRGGHRPYPSGGGYYPIEVYVINKEKSYQLYHFEPNNFVLEKLWELQNLTSFNELFTNADGHNYDSIIILTSNHLPQAEKYNNRSYQLQLLEAGHIAQNILLCAAAANLNHCPFVGYNDAIIGKLLHIDAAEEYPVYMIGIGKKYEV